MKSINWQPQYGLLPTSKCGLLFWFFFLSMVLLIYFDAVLVDSTDTTSFLLSSSLLAKGNRLSHQHVSKSKLDFAIAPEMQKAFSYFHKQAPVDCTKILAKDAAEIDRAATFDRQDRRVSILPDTEYLSLTRNCGLFRTMREYPSQPASDEEATFPLAYAILLYQHVEQFERLLRLIYQPQNVYCIYIDGNAKLMVVLSVMAIVRCFPNVFIIEDREPVRYPYISLLEAMSINCSRHLLHSPVHWKYFINLASQMFPLRTNRELVQILKLMGGFNIIFPYIPKARHLVKRVKTSVRWQRKSPPPHNLTVAMGYDHIVASRELVEFIHTSPIVKDLLDWLRDTTHPGETFWNTVQWNMQFHPPGGSDLSACPSGDNESHVNCTYWLSRFSQWSTPCGENGKIVRFVAIFGLRCLDMVISQPHISANKFYLDYEKSAFECMEEWFRNRTAAKSNLHDSKTLLAIYETSARNMKERNQSYYAHEHSGSKPSAR